ncbi:MAG TPA: SIMPL domain-containing protein [Spirochaetia bacterium]|nr:SIMPL domain-containing protein [Spirochaetia bacterium]
MLHLVFNRYTVSLAFVVGAFLAPISLAAEGSAESTSARTISVSGTGTVLASPDIATVRIGVESRNADVKRALNATADRMKAVVAAVEAAGVAEKDISTVDYRVDFMQNDQQQSSATGRTGTYIVTDVAEVTIHEIGRLGTVLDGALGAGANDLQGVTFALANPAPVEQQARAIAFRQAYDRADQLAKLSGSTIVRALKISEAGSGAGPSLPMLKAAVFAGSPPVNAGQLEVTVTVQATFQVK